MLSLALVLTVSCQAFAWSILASGAGALAGGATHAASAQGEIKAHGGARFLALPILCLQALAERDLRSAQVCCVSWSVTRVNSLLSIVRLNRLPSAAHIRQMTIPLDNRTESRHASQHASSPSCFARALSLVLHDAPHDNAHTSNKDEQDHGKACELFSHGDAPRADAAALMALCDIRTASSSRSATTSSSHDDKQEMSEYQDDWLVANGGDDGAVPRECREWARSKAKRQGTTSSAPCIE